MSYTWEFRERRSEEECDYLAGYAEWIRELAQEDERKQRRAEERRDALWLAWVLICVVVIVTASLLAKGM